MWNDFWWDITYRLFSLVRLLFHFCHFDCEIFHVFGFCIYQMISETFKILCLKSAVLIIVASAWSCYTLCMCPLMNCKLWFHKSKLCIISGPRERAIHLLEKSLSPGDEVPPLRQFQGNYGSCRVNQVENHLLLLLLCVFIFGEEFGRGYINSLR